MGAQASSSGQEARGESKSLSGSCRTERQGNMAETHEAPRTLATVLSGGRFFCGTLVAKGEVEATVLIDTPRGGAMHVSGKLIESLG